MATVPSLLTHSSAETQTNGAVPLTADSHCIFPKMTFYFKKNKVSVDYYFGVLWESTNRCKLSAGHSEVSSFFPSVGFCVCAVALLLQYKIKGLCIFH